MPQQLHQNDLFGIRRGELSQTMVGFTGLIDAVQGMLVGWSMATGEIWETGDMDTTLAIVDSMVVEFYQMTRAFGLEK